MKFSLYASLFVYFSRDRERFCRSLLIDQKLYIIDYISSPFSCSSSKRIVLKLCASTLSIYLSHLSTCSHLEHPILLSRESVLYKQPAFTLSSLFFHTS